MADVVVDLIYSEDTCGSGRGNGGGRVVFVPDIGRVGGNNGPAGAAGDYTADTKASCTVAICCSSFIGALGPSNKG